MKLFSKAFIKKLRGWEKWGWDQANGYYQPDCPSCFGSYLAHTFHKVSSYMAGEDYFYTIMKEMGFSEPKATQMLQDAGAGNRHPFKDTAQWDNPPSIVMKNLFQKLQEQT